MKIYLEYFAQLRDLAARSHEERETTVTTPAALYEDIKKEYCFPFHRKQLRVAVNDAFVPWDYPLKAGERVVFIPPVTGG
ncbi:MoaD/ThiS family protein [Saccharibacter sp. 17.LH.SD]|uniref:MoaD/ThiS family protein n=1 Tax=Saccharibacter sp. 17.LH.SD TaxID=2689393 RepID=UPI00136E24D1|nr:MoaD/ThiS family protein [Saccharibacter sp. 17.LH.SD]